MHNCKSLLLLACTFFAALSALAQSSASATSPANNGFMRSEAKINVVMVVVVTILAGLLIYLVRLDRKITKLEKGENF